MKRAASSKGGLAKDEGKRRFAETPEPRGRRTAKEGPKRAPVPSAVHPELATLIDAPFDDDDWLFEIKWDGFRAIAAIDARGKTVLTSRNGKDLGARFQPLSDIADCFASRPVVVDGEIVALQEDGRSSFQRLQNAATAAPSSLRYVVFDVLYAEGRDLRKEPLDARKEVLARIVKKGEGPVVLSPFVVGQGKAMFAEAARTGLEGIVGKKRSAPYLEKRTRDWVKIKAQKEQECVIAGWTEPGTGARAGFGSLILAVYEKGKLTYCGNVGTGFDGATLRTLARKLAALETKECPFAKPPKTRTRAHWVEPKLVAQVHFTEWTSDGAMRHPVFLGLRDDKRARSVHREWVHAVREVNR